MLHIFDTSGGGIGKQIISTSVAKSIKNKYPDDKLWVITSAPLVYQNISWVDRVYQIGNTSQLYQFMLDEAKGNNNINFFKSEPYYHKDYISGRKHIIEAWHEQLNLELTGSPTIELNENEIKGAKNYLTKVFKGKIIGIKTVGGAYNKEGKVKNYYRDLNQVVAQEVVDKLKDKYGFVNLINGVVEPKLGGALNFDRTDLRQCFAILDNCDLVVTIDTYSLHAAYALNKPTIAIWGATNPKTLGYIEHTNLVKNACPTPSCGRPNSYLSDTNPDNSPWTCPYGAKCLDFTSDEMIEKIEEKI